MLRYADFMPQEKEVYYYGNVKKVSKFHTDYYPGQVKSFWLQVRYNRRYCFFNCVYTLIEGPHEHKGGDIHCC